MRHETVVEYVAKRTSVVPLRFGTIYLERHGIEQMLAERSRELARTGRSARHSPTTCPPHSVSLWTVTWNGDFAKGLVGLLGREQAVGGGVPRDAPGEAECAVRSRVDRGPVARLQT